MTPLKIGIIVAFVSVFSGWLLGVLTNALIAFFKSGRVEKKAAYVLTLDCEKRRGECCLPVMKRDIATMETRLRETEKKLDHGEAKFDLLIKEIGSVRLVVERIQAVVEYALEIKQKGEKGVDGQ